MKTSENLFEAALHGFVLEEGDGAHQVADEDKVSLALQVQSDDVVEVAALEAQLFFGRPLVQTHLPPQNPVSAHQKNGNRMEKEVYVAYGVVDGGEDLGIEVDERVAGAFDVLLGDGDQLAVLPLEQDDAALLRLRLFGHHQRRADDVVRVRVVAEARRHDAQRVLVLLELVRVQHCATVATISQFVANN